MTTWRYTRWIFLLVCVMSVLNSALNCAVHNYVAGVIWAVGSVFWYMGYHNACKLAER